MTETEQVELNTVKTEQCNICMELRDLKTCGNSNKETECNYKMCEKCIKKISQDLEKKCPQCRKEIIHEVPEDSAEDSAEENYNGNGNCVECCTTIGVAYLVCGCCAVFNTIVGSGIIYTFDPSIFQVLLKCNCGSWFETFCLGTAVSTCTVINCHLVDAYYTKRYGVTIFENKYICCCYKYGSTLINTCERMLDLYSGGIDNEEMERE